MKATINENTPPPSAAILKSPLHLFYHWEENTPHAPFLKQPLGKGWKVISYREAGTEARRMARALHTLGLKKGSHIGILSKNCYHWVLSDLAISMAGGVSAPFYPTLAAKELGEVLELGDVDALFVGKLDEWEEKKKGMPQDMPIIRFPHYPGSAKVERGYEWDELCRQNAPLEGQPHPAWDDIWTIIFTSGTTGTPKGVVHDFRNAGILIGNEMEHDTLGLQKTDSPRHFSYLPLNHVADRIAVAGIIMTGGSVSFAESLDTFAQNLQDTQPTVFLAVPRIWSKFQLGVLEKMPQKRLDMLLRIPVLSGIVKKKIRKALGLGSVKNCFTSTAITPEPLKKWYERLGIKLQEVYGMTEVLGPFSVMPPDAPHTDSVGLPMPGGACKIDPENGEILMSIPWMMKGYYKDEARTRQVLQDGWLRTGDKGEMDTDGFLKIIGRVRDTFKTAKGKFIVPTLIEGHLSDSDLIEQACVTGLGLPQPIGLIALSEIARQLEEAQLQQALLQLLDTANAQLHKHEKLSHLVLVSENWSDQNGFLTPTLKLRRGAILGHYGERIPAWAQMEAGLVWA